MQTNASCAESAYKCIYAKQRPAGEQTGWPKGLRKAYINSETKRYKNTVLFHRPHKWYFSIKFKINKRHICYLYFTYWHFCINYVALFDWIAPSVARWIFKLVQFRSPLPINRQKISTVNYHIRQICSDKKIPSVAYIARPEVREDGSNYDA